MSTDLGPGATVAQIRSHARTTASALKKELNRAYELIVHQVEVGTLDGVALLDWYRLSVAHTLWKQLAIGLDELGPDPGIRACLGWIRAVHDHVHDGTPHVAASDPDESPIEAVNRINAAERERFCGELSAWLPADDRPPR